MDHLAAAAFFYERTLGAEIESRGERPDMQYMLLRLGGTELELMHSTDPGAPIGKFLAKRGEGLHHVAYEVDDLDAELARLRGDGVEIAGDIRIGVHGTRVAFLHPKSMTGVLTELVERPA